MKNARSWEQASEVDYDNHPDDEGNFTVSFDPSSEEWMKSKKSLTEGKTPVVIVSVGGVYEKHVTLTVELRAEVNWYKFGPFNLVKGDQIQVFDGLGEDAPRLSGVPVEVTRIEEETNG